MRPAAVLASLLLALCALLGGCTIVDLEQRRWLFMPGTRTWPPGEAAAVGMQDMWIDYVSQHPEQARQPVRLHALWLPQLRPDAPVILFLHGVH
jgi:hypothetical protein